jgi:hypothetical protein
METGNNAFTSLLQAKGRNLKTKINLSFFQKSILLWHRFMFGKTAKNVKKISQYWAFLQIKCFIEDLKEALRVWSLIRNEKPIVLFERHCHVTVKSEASACERRCRSSRLAKRNIGKNGGQRRRGTRGRWPPFPPQKAVKCSHVLFHNSAIFIDWSLEDLRTVFKTVFSRLREKFAPS